MSWVAVNSATCRRPTVFCSITTDSPTKREDDIQKDDHTNGSSDAEYCYRDEILKAAANLVTGRPKTKKVPKISNTSIHKVVKANSGVPRKRKQTTPVHQDDLEEDYALAGTHQHSKRYTEYPEVKRKPLRDVTNTSKSRPTKPEALQKHMRPATPSKKKTLSGERDTVVDKTDALDLYHFIPAQKSNQMHKIAKPAPPIIEISSDDDTSNSTHTVRADSDYDQFDDSVFDEVLQTKEHSELKGVPEEPSTSCPTSLSYPNGASFPPFLHPCLLVSSDNEASSLGHKDKTTSSSKHTCFRTAEVLRLTRHVKEQVVPNGQTVRIEVFATVQEVKYADRLGRGQGIVLSDLFFPNKPPYVTTVSRTPYVAKELTPKPRYEQDPKPIFKVILQFDAKGITTPGHSKSHANSNPRSSQNSSSQSESTSLEVLDIQPTS